MRFLPLLCALAACGGTSAAAPVEPAPVEPIRNADAWVAEAEAHLSAGRPMEATQAAERALADGDRADALALLGDARTDLENWDGAVQAYQGALRIGGPDPDTYVALGEAFEAQGAFAQAENVYLLAAEERRGDLWPLIAAARTRIERGDGQGALELLEEHRHLRPSASPDVQAAFDATCREAAETAVAGAPAGTGVGDSPRGGGGVGENPIELRRLGTIGGSEDQVPHEEAAEPVVSDRAVVRGSLSRDEIREVIRGRLPEARVCYERELIGDPTLEGRITVRFVIGADGSVQEANVADDAVGSPGLASCLTAAVRQWRFPEPRGGGIVIVNYPFQFTASH